MNDQEQRWWLARRAAFGLAPGEAEAQAATSPDAVLAQLVDPDANGVAPAPDPWQAVDLGEARPDAGTFPREAGRQAVGAWLLAMATTNRPLEERMRWFWHGHFVSALPVVKSPLLMVNQLRMFGALGLGDFRTLLRAVTIDPAMLIYLDGTTNKADAVNENYGREVLELFALGIGNYSEADVRAGAEALTGWVVTRDGSVRFAPPRHDDRAKSYLGGTAHDLDTVIDRIVEHDSCAPFVAGQLARAFLGPDVDQALEERLGRDFRASGLQIRPLLQQILEDGLEGAGSPDFAAPVPWLARVLRATGASSPRLNDPIGSGLKAAGQVPLAPPNVGGWPGGVAWLASAVTVARWNMATAIAGVALANPASTSTIAVAARGRDAGGLASVLGIGGGFSAATRQAIESAPAGQSGDVAALSAALSSPEMVVV